MSVSSPRTCFTQPALASQFHLRLNRHNSSRLTPKHVTSDWTEELEAEHAMRLMEGHFVETERARVANAAGRAPRDADRFMEWFEQLRATGPGQHDPLFPWLGQTACFEQMRWFLTQEAAGEAGFEDLVALTQIKCPARAKLEMARNYWDEMGRGHERGMHGPMLDATVRELDLQVSAEDTVWEALALSNLMIALAANRRYAYQAIGALGAIEMTAPTRVCHVNDGLKRLGVTASARLYFQLHAGLDIAHSKAWNEEVIAPLVRENPELCQPIAEGALMRLEAGARCFSRYRSHFAAAPSRPRALPAPAHASIPTPLQFRVAANEKLHRPIGSEAARG